ncbi:MAG TPA: DUF3179 domain-containing (seleno)protein [Gemmatimonadaceae bacterium]|nr:DUF3179 domain-containing (seleno)protein [Gemmatimonadaceae bacterium]
MKKLFYLGVVLAVLFEAANVYFIMPMPYSQRVRSIDLAYFLYSWRWLFRIAFGLMIVAGAASAWRVQSWRKVFAVASLLIVGGVAYLTNFMMSADHMFLQPSSVAMRPADSNVVESNRLVVGVVVNGEARAYPVQFIGYHHQVRDSIGGKPVMVSFCTVCRTGRVFDPLVGGKPESFRLVGMDHFNAMFEDKTTGSWWRQATGEAVAGSMKGKALTELPSQQVTLAQWLTIHPKSLIMQPDPQLRRMYSKSFDYETGASRSSLTGTDTVSWHDKAWVVGVAVNGESKAYDWNRLRRESVVNDEVGQTPIVLVLASDKTSFFVFQRPDNAILALRGDSLIAPGKAYAISGVAAGGALKPLAASQEFWHSWRTFHPGTKTY